jgi:hypothetical protein
MERGGVTATVTGEDTVARTLRSAGHKLGDLEKANQMVANLFVSRARDNAPRLTGALAAATVPEYSRDEAGFSNVLPYFGPIHYGWPAHNIEAQPYVDEAVDETESDWLAIYEDAAAAACDLVHGV